MIPADLKFLNSKESIPSDISTLDKFDVDTLRRFWKVFKTSSNVLPAGHRLENLFWRLWGSERLHKRLSGSRIACLFMMIQQGEEAFERENPKLRIPEFGRAACSRIAPRGSDIPPTPPPSPIDSHMSGLGGRPPMSRLPSQSDITASLYQAFSQQQQIPIRPSPPGPPRVPPPSPATPMASPLLAAVAARSGQAGYFTGSDRPAVVTSNSDNTMMNINSAGIAPPRNTPLRPQQPARNTSSSTILPVVEEITPTTQSGGQQKGPKRSESSVSIAESTTSSTSAKLGKKAKLPKKGVLPKGKAKFAAGKKGGMRPALVRQKSSTSSTVVEQEDAEEEEEYEEEVVEPKMQTPIEQKPIIQQVVQIEEPKHVEAKKSIAEKPPVIQKKPAMEVVSDIAEEDADDFEDEDEPVAAAPPPMRRTISAGPALGGKKNKKGSSTRLSKKNRNVSANAGKAAPGLGIAAALGGPGTKKENELPAPLPTVSIVEPDFRRIFQEKYNIATQPVPTQPVPTEDSTGKGKGGGRLVFLTSETEARTVKSQATVSIATPTSSVVVARKVQGQSVLVVETGEIRGLNTRVRVPMAGKAEFEKAGGSGLGGSGPVGGSNKSTLSMMIEDEKRKNSEKVGYGSASLGRR